MIENMLELFAQLGYSGILILMLLESTVFPIPSELVMIPAGVLAAQGRMNPFLAVFMGILGSLLGALINYWVGRKLGKPVLDRYGKYVLLPPHRMARVERFFLRHGEISTFTGRLILGVRHLISIPAGLARMNLGRFVFFTIAGSGIWVSILTVLGYIAGRELERVTTAEVKALWAKYSTPITVGLILFCGLVILAYILWRRHHHKTTSAA
jgi:membrane protein DedA with SNARE-associated domain